MYRCLVLVLCLIGGTAYAQGIGRPLPNVAMQQPRADYTLGRAPYAEYVGTIIDPIEGWDPARIVHSNIIPIKKYLPNYPFKYMMICSRDHVGSNNGGFLFVSNSITSGWQNADDVGSAFTDAGYSAPTNPVITNSSSSDEGEFFYLYWNPWEAKLCALGHSANYGVAQSQGIWTSDDGATFTQVGLAHDRPAISTEGHTGYGSYQLLGSRFVGTSLSGQLPSCISNQHVFSADGIEWVLDSRRLYGRELTAMGITDKEIIRVGPYFRFDGRYWQVCCVRTMPSEGGGVTSGVVCACPVSSDLRRVVAPPVVLAGLSGEEDEREVAAEQSTPGLYQADDGTVWITHQVEDGDGTRRVGVTRILPADARSFDTSRVPARAWAIQTNYESLAAAFDTEGYLLPSGPSSRRVHADYVFSRISETPDDAEFNATTGEPTETYVSSATSRGELQLMIPDTSGANGSYEVGAPVDTTYISEMWIHVYGFRVTSSGNASYLDIGFTSDALNYQYSYNMRAAGGGNTFSRLYQHNGMSNVTERQLTNFNPLADARIEQGIDLSVGLIKRLKADKTVQAYLVLMDGDQFIDAMYLPSFADQDLRGFIRGLRISDANTISLTRVTVEVAEAWTGT